MLPSVKPELLSSGIQSYLHNENFTLEVFAKIKKENPVLWELILIAVDNTEISDEFKEGYIRAALQFYYLLNAQDECDELAK